MRMIMIFTIVLLSDQKSLHVDTSVLQQLVKGRRTRTRYFASGSVKLKLLIQLAATAVKPIEYLSVEGHLSAELTFDEEDTSVRLNGMLSFGQCCLGLDIISTERHTHTPET